MGELEWGSGNHLEGQDGWGQQANVGNWSTNRGVEPEWSYRGKLGVS